MIVNLARRGGDITTTLPLENVIFEGGEPHLGVTATFTLDGHETQGMVIGVSSSSLAVPPDPSVVTTVTVEETDEANASPESSSDTAVRP